MFYKKINLECYASIKLWSENFLKDKTVTNGLTVIKENFPMELEEMINSELKIYNISVLSSVIFFLRRRSKIPFDVSDLHIDGGRLSPYHVSLVLPISGCSENYQYWFGGDYNITLSKSATSATYYRAVNWKEPPSLIDYVRISDTPTLTKTDIPHSATNLHNDLRIVCTVRFKNNPTFDEVCSEFYDS